MKRWIWFILMILAGFAAGLGYGWYVNPVEYVDSAPEALKSDYKTDVVLMTAEAYAAEGDLAAAVQRLSLLGGSAPLESVRQAVQFGEKVGYAQVDLALMRALSAALEAASPAETRTP